MIARRQRLLPLAVIPIALAARIIPGPRVIDDAYITFRYARNLVAGHGLVFNPGEAVLGTTTPLYSLILALLSLPFGGVGAPFPEIAWILNALVDGVVCLLLMLLGARLGSSAAGYAAGLAWAISPMAVTFSIGGMETSLTIALVLAAFYLHIFGRPTGAALPAALALLARPDTALFIGPLALERGRQISLGLRRRPSEWRLYIREVGLFLLPLISWSAVGWGVYGSPVTSSIGAKIDAYLISPSAALVRLLQHYATPFFGHKTFGVPWIGVGLLVFPILFGLGTIRTVRRNPAAWPLFASVWIYFAAFALANPLIFRWYLAPPLPFYFLGIFLGGARISDDSKSRLPLSLLAAGAIALTSQAWVLHPDHGPDRPAPEMAYIELELLYEGVARDLTTRLGPEDTLAAGDIGALGYYTEARVLDTLGLISPEAQRYYPADREQYLINYAIPPALIEDLKPHYLVILEAYGRRSLLMDPTFVQHYRLERTIPTDIYGSRGLLVFHRVGK